MAIDRNPDAVQGAPPPRAGVYAVNGTTLYAEVRGQGPAVMLVGAADEDAEMYRGIAERLPERTVVTYDRRGTLRSGREDWPGGGSAQHADDAAALLVALGIDRAAVFGASAGGIVALQLALRYPSMVSQALVYEAGYFQHVSGGAEIMDRGRRAVEVHLANHPGDWPGAVAALGRSIAEGPHQTDTNLLAPPPGRDWFEDRGNLNAHSLVVGDLDLPSEVADLEGLRDSEVHIHFAYGTRSRPVFREIAETLAATRGAEAQAVVGAGHVAVYHPDLIAAFILEQLVAD
ncbi:MAG TPA: alpha/beta hydrolase [Acidimicrobiia bacterium]|nr:alpha/beta hydrolase [Acidimicrobiia bacterium]